MLRRLRTLPLFVLGVASLSACVSLGGKTPPFLLTLDAAAAPVAGEARTASEAATLTILIPTAPQKLRTVRIIHGKGTGTLRTTVHALLQRSPLVHSFRLGDETSGSWGATLVTLNISSAQS